MCKPKFGYIIIQRLEFILLKEKNMHLSQHCRIRMNQRGFSENMVNIVLKYGVETRKNNVLKVNLGKSNLSHLKSEIKKLETKITFYEDKTKKLIAKKCLLHESKNDYYDDYLIESDSGIRNVDPSTKLNKTLICYRRKIKNYRKRINGIRHLIDKAGVELLRKDDSVITIYKKSRHTF